jgi:SAM-dependent methyltransferase
MSNGLTTGIEITLETAVCPVCGLSGSPQFEQQDLLCGVGGRFGQSRCETCQMYFLSPRVPEAEIGRYYPPAYPCYQEDRHPRFVRKLAGVFGLTLRKRRIVERYLQGGRILDIGCGNGFFLRTLGGGQWQRYAMDLRWQGAGECPGEFHEGNLDHAAPRLRDLDAVTLWHVFEHLYHPRKALENAAFILKPGGLLFLAIPDLRSIEPHLFGKYWVGWDPPRHIATYSRRGLETLLREAGFRLVDVVPDVCTGELFLLSVDFLLRSRGYRRQVQGSIVLRLLLAPVVFALNWLGFAPAKVYVAQR